MDTLAVARLCRSYPSAGRTLDVLRDVTFAIAGRSTCAIMGPSGSGKSTLLGLCAGLDRPTSGTVTLLGRDLGALDEDALAELRGREVGFVFQSFRLLPTLTALENVLVPLELRGSTAGGAAEAAARELLARVGLGDRLDHLPAQLSGGEQQRVALARAFVHRPRVLFADEPTGELDGDTGRLVTDLLFELNREHGTALLLVTHDRELAARCERVITLRNGRVAADSADSAASAGTADGAAP